MESRLRSAWWYIRLALRTFVGLLTVTAVFVLARYWWSDPVAVLLSITALTMTVARFIVFTTLPQHGSGADAQRWDTRARKLYLLQGIVGSALLLTALISRVVWLSALFALWAAVSFLIWGILSRRASDSPAEATEVPQGLQLNIKRRIVWTMVGAIPVSLTVGVLFVVGVIKFWGLLALTAILSTTMGLVVVAIFFSSYRKAS